MPRSRPVVLFSAGLAGDGVARNTVNLANALARRGVDAEVVCLHAGPLAEALRGARLTVLGRPSGPRGAALALSTPALRRTLAAAQPSVVVSMGNHAHLAVWAALRSLSDIPRVYRISNDPLHGGQEPTRRRLRELGLRLVAADATRIVCVSRAIAGLPPFRRARRDRRLDVLPNGVDVAAIRRCAAEPVRHPWLDDGGPFLVAVGRVHPQKNHASLIEALARLRQGASSDLRLLVLGAAPAGRVAPLLAQARACGVADAIRFEGEVANPFPLLARAAAYVLPSRWEGASNSLLEAMACGVPVVASRTAGAASEVLGGGRYGRLADPGDSAGLADAIAAQLSPTARIGPGERAEAYALEAVMTRLSAIVLAAASAHDEIQMSPEGPAHPEPVPGSFSGGRDGVLT